MRMPKLFNTYLNMEGEITRPEVTSSYLVVGKR